MNRKRKRGSKDKPHKLQDLILEFINEHKGQAFSEKHIMRRLGIRGKKSQKPFIRALIDLELDGKIKELPNGLFTSAKAIKSIRGKLDFVNPRFGYVITDQFEHDIWVSARDMMGAMDGDQVEVAITKLEERFRRPEGRITRIVERGRTEFVGRIEISPKFAFVVPDNRKMHQDIFVHLGKVNKAAHNDKVIVKVVEWSVGTNNPVGEVIEVLGPAGENDAEIHSIMAEFGLPFRFEEEVEQFAEKISDRITKSEIDKRKDFRDIITFTIDPDDAKDFDDALSFKKLENGHVEVGIHIADVTHYVKPGNLLDKEGYHRATSVYLVDRTVPMLPERLSNGLCSLRPNEDKLTFSAVFELDRNARIIHEWFGRTIIHSDRRFTYEEAQEVINTGEGDHKEEITILNGLAKKLKEKRFENGAFNFETVEVKFSLDDRGVPTGIIPKVRQDAHKLIEEFMLLANKRVANFIFQKNDGAHTFVYRTHDSPDPEKLENFAQFAKRFGHNIDLKKGNLNHELNKLIESIEGKPEQNVLESLAIRSMAKAKYTTDPKPHFGLAFDHYSHFTSPIRRYPDMMVHRLLQHYLDGNKSESKDDFEEKCLHSSEMEKRAADAERASIKYKQVEYMSLMEDKPFDGIITGVTEWGIFVEIIETKCEGMVRLSDMDDDFYEFDEKNYCIVGTRKNKRFTLGDKVIVRVLDTDIDRRTIDLEFTTHEKRTIDEE